MLLESRVILSLFSIFVLLLSFVASFKYKDASLFFLGLIASILINRCDKRNFANIKKKFTNNKENNNQNMKFSKFTAESTDTPTEPVVTPVDSTEPAESTDAPIDSPAEPPADSPAESAPVVDVPAQATPDVTQTRVVRRPDPSEVVVPRTVDRQMKNLNIDYIDQRSMQRQVYGFGRPTLGEVVSSKGDLSKLTPNFVNFAHTIVGNIRDPREPGIPVDSTVPQNPELLKLQLPAPNMVVAKDYFPSCRDSLPYHAKQDPRSASRCRITGIY